MPIWSRFLMQRRENGLDRTLTAKEPWTRNHLPINTHYQGSVEELQKPKRKVPVKAEFNVISDNIGALSFLDLRSFPCLASYFKKELAFYLKVSPSRDSYVQTHTHTPNLVCKECLPHGPTWVLIPLSPATT